MRRSILVLIAATALCQGCLASNLTELTQALGQDPASVCVKLTLSTPWGTQLTRVARSNIPAGSLKCNDDGLTIDTAPPPTPR